MQPRQRTQLREQARTVNKEIEASRKEVEKLQPDPSKAAAELCKRHLSEFVKEFWDIVIKQPMQWNWHMDILCKEVETVYKRAFMRYDKDGNPLGRLPKEYDLLINVPPGSSKSTIVSQMAQAWGWSNDPTLKYIFGTHGMKLSLVHADKQRQIVQSDKYRLFYDYIALRSDRNSMSEYYNTKGGMRYSTSVGSSITGVHGDINTIDDPVPVEPGEITEGVLEKANDWINNTLETRQSDKERTITIMIMQRVHVNDPSGHWLKMVKDDKDGVFNIRHICLPSSISDNISPKELAAYYIDGLLDPLRMNEKVLAAKKFKLGSAQFAGQFGQRPVPKGGLIWKKWFIEVPDEVFPSRSLMTNYSTDWDLAYTKDDENAASSWVTSGQIGTRNYIDDFGFVYLEFPELIKLMKKIPGPHYIEAKASGKSAKQSLLQQGITAIEVQVSSDKIGRANTATPNVEAGLWYIRKSLAERLYSDPEQGILFFPKGAKADVADVLAQCIIRQSKKGTWNVNDSSTTAGNFGSPNNIDLLDY